MNTKIILVLFCVIVCCLAKRKKYRERGQYQDRWENQRFRPNEMNDERGLRDWGSLNEHNYRPYRPIKHHEYMHLPPFMTVGFPQEEVMEEPEPVLPAAPSAPLNPVLGTLSALPLSLYNNYICNMFGIQEVSPNITPDVVRQKRALFSSGFFRMLRDFRHVVQGAYRTLKPFHSGSSNDLLKQIQNVALSSMNTLVENGRLHVEDVVQAFIQQTMQSEGVVGDAKRIFEAIQQLADENRHDIEESTQEAVDNSCGVINNEFYCNYMKKLSAKSGCSGQYFTTEILDKCCSSFVNEAVITETAVSTIEAPIETEASAVAAPADEAPIVAVPATEAPIAVDPTTEAPVVVAPTTEAPVVVVAPTTEAPIVVAPTTEAPIVVAPTTEAPIVVAPTTEAPIVVAPTTEAPVVVAPTTEAPITVTTAALKTCGISSTNPATRFTDFSSAMNQVRIVGGVDAEKCEYPWMVRLQVGNALCGGTILDETHILTAGHCIGENTASDITAHVGEHDYNTLDSDDATHTVKDVQVHPDYNELAYGGVDNDVAILTLDEPITFTDCAQPICLPNAGDGAAIEPNTQCVVAGWGTTSSGGQTSNILQEVTVPTYSGEDCSAVFTETTPSNPSTQLCAGRPVIGGADSCQGDSGGPLFCPVNGQYVQYGIVSYGAGCADAGAAGVYADTSAMLDFINSVTGA